MIHTVQYTIYLSTISIFIISVVSGVLIPDRNSRLKGKKLHEKITRDCHSQGIFIPHRALEEYASCFSQSHMLFTYKSEDDLPDYIPGNQTGLMMEHVLLPFCADWRKRTKCIADNSNYIRQCLTNQKNILMDCNMAFGNALCSKSGGELYEVYAKFVDAGGIRCILDQKGIQQGMLSCININPTETPFHSNIYRITSCMVKQLKRCPSDQPMELLQKIVDISRPFYKSNGIYSINSGTGILTHSLTDLIALCLCLYSLAQAIFKSVR